MNLFDISKIVESTNLKNNKDGTITVSIYGVSGGLLKNLCPELKVGDVIKVFFQPLRWTAPKPPLVMVVGDVIFDRNTNTRLTVTEKSLNKPVWFYNNDYTERGLPGITIIGNILITTDLTITNKNHNERYTPYNYLQSNKRMIKVSDVCQLVPISDKADTVIGGITFTNNHDGSWTISGTSSEYRFYRLYEDLPLKQGHVYLNTEGSGSTYVEIMWVDKTGVVHWGDNPYTADENSKCNITLIRLVEATNTVTLYPQLFDLTEMFGPGHEPTTVAEFRQRFPNEYYPYSPQCWLTSYKSAVVCKTKNLFDINSAVKVSGASSFSKNGNQITVSTNDTYHYISANVLLDTSLVGKTVTFSAYAKTSDKNTAFLRIQWMTPNGLGSKNMIESNTTSGQAYQKVSLTGVVPVQPDDEHNMLCLSFYSDGPNTTTLPPQLYTVVYTDIQLEQGSTATSYVPYQHL